MIINSLKADNFLKYSKLELDELPKDGVIAISGGNESGKTSIGEAISYALFGRTFAVDFDRIARVIKWGEELCDVEMEFEISENRYKIERQTDKQGYCNVKLHNVSGHSEQLIAEGNAPVADSMAEILGYSYSEFIESYYLVQRDIPLPDAGAEAIKKISGVSEYEIKIFDLHNAHDSQEERKEKLEKTRYDLNQEKELALTFDERIAQLEADKKGVEEAIQALQSRNDELETFVNDIDEFIEAAKKDAANIAAARVSSSYRQWLELLQNLRMTISELETLTPAFVDEIPLPITQILERVIDFEERLVGFEAIYENLAEYRDELGVMLGETAPASKGQYSVIPAQEKIRLQTEIKRNKIVRYSSTMLLIALVIFSIIFFSSSDYDRSGGFIFAILSGAMVLALVYAVHKLKNNYDSSSIQLEMVKEKIKQIKKEAQEIDDLINVPLAEAITYLAEHKDKKISREAIEYKEGLGLALTDKVELSIMQRDIQREARVLTTEYQPLMNSAKEEQKDIIQQLALSNESFIELDDKITEMHENARPLEQIELDITKAEQDLIAINQDIDKTIADIEQAKSDAEKQAKNFSQGVAKWVTNAISHLTAGKYSEVRINDQLNVILFSEQKGDFIEFDEVSSGTRRQILLAVRIAISQGLCENRDNKKQMLFLDEPFAFFDRNRISSSIKALPNLSEELSQIWVVNQDLVEECDFTIHIECDENNQDLILQEDLAE